MKFPVQKYTGWAVSHATKTYVECDVKQCKINGVKRDRSQKKIERGPNFATFNVTSFTYNGILPFVNYARRYYKNCCTKLPKCKCDFTDLI